MSKNGASSGPWRIEEGTAVTPDGFDEIVQIKHGDSAPLYVPPDDLPLLLGALMTFMGVDRIEATS